MMNEAVKLTTPNEQSPKIQKVASQGKLPAKRSNQQTMDNDRSHEFQQPLPKKSCQALHKSSPQI